jgi:serine/threonine protein kinase
MSEDNKKKGDESEKKDEADFPTLSLPGAGELSDSPTALLGTRIGYYKLVSVLGEGGFGIVSRAEQEEPVKRDVALKIIKPGMDSIKVIGRFEAERQALAWLDHPNIAHIYDGGTTEVGHPYFVMEYVEGTPITEYCDEQKLSIKERLELFEQVCKAAQHAHQKGIIHRDIKPSNVLVSLQDDKPVPKIIDFGIAKAVSQSSTEQTFTEEGQFVGTPEYTSPEQATLNNQDIDTRSDIYSLGVLLYELLTGKLPFESSMLHQVAFDERMRIIRQEDPPRPSARLSSLGEEAEKIAQCRQTEVGTLTKRLHKELEWIPMMAMRKEPNRRYQAASEFAQDIRDYLNGNPLMAGPESVTYRLKKTIKRHRVVVFATLVVLMTLAAGIVATMVFAFKAIEERDKKDIALKEKEIALKQAEDANNIAQKKREEAEKALYINQINLAQKYYEANNIGPMCELLTACPKDLRGWEYYYLWCISDQARMTLRGHKGQVLSVAFSPDSRRIVSGSFDNTLKVWDANTGREVMTLQGHEQPVFSVVFSPDGKRIVSGSAVNSLKNLGCQQWQRSDEYSRT